jgi:ATP-dependent Lhr-like helicase
MMDSQASSSEGASRSSASFDRLHADVRRWIWDQGWAELRDIQETAITLLLEGSGDVLISAATAGGKTEAAFLPICSRIMEEDAKPGVRAVYIGPLKALINDQFDRLDGLCERLALPVHRWHGDVSQSQKHRLLDEPAGILLITPESLEALFVRRGHRLAGLFAGLSYVVVDELHAFIGNERGRQLQSLLHRLELTLRRGVPRVGLSATLGDMMLAADFLRPGRGKTVHQVISHSDSQELRLQLRGYLNRPVIQEPGSISESRTSTDDDQPALAQDVFSALRGTTNLVFCNRRAGVEVLADQLRRLSEARGVPNEFLPHHGSLARDIRLDVEERLKQHDQPCTVICTNTLELGIDVGRVSSVGQIDSPHSVASLRQRLGRSGRRGDPAILRAYVTEVALDKDPDPQDAIRVQTFQTIAFIQLLLQRWVEPPTTGGLHLSTLVQQVVSTIAQHGGAHASQLWEALCVSGPFTDIQQQVFTELLRNLGQNDILIQTTDGSLLLGTAGEALVNHYDFYSAFTSPEEFRLYTGGHEIGSLPIYNPVSVGMLLIFAGRRWQVTNVDLERNVIHLVPAAGGRPPAFTGGAAGQVHDRVREEMFRLYASTEVPVYLDSTARSLVDEGRQNFHRLGLAESRVILHGKDVVVFPWMGDRAMNSILVELMSRGFSVSKADAALHIHDADQKQVFDQIVDLSACPIPDPVLLARSVIVKRSEKHDWLLDEHLLDLAYAARSIDPCAAHQFFASCVGQSGD